MIRSLFAGLCFAAAVYAAPPDFSGQWKMNTAQSEFGPMAAAAPQVLTRTIKQSGVLFEYKSYQKGPRGEVNSDIKYTTDGKPCENQGAKGTARWLGDDLLIEYTRDINGVEISSKEMWALGGGGKTLTIRSHVSIPQQGEYDVKLVLDKQ